MAAAEVELGEHDLMALAYLGHHGDHLPDRLAVQPRVGELRPELAMQSDQVQARLIQHALDRAGRLTAGQSKAEFPVGVDVGDHPDQDTLATTQPPRGEKRDLAGRVDHHAPHPGGGRIVQLAGSLGIAVQDDPRRRHAAGQDGGQLAARADGHAGTFGGRPPGHCGAQQRHSGVDQLDIGERGAIPADAGPKVFFIHHVGGCAEFGRDLGGRHPADTQPASFVDVRAERPDRAVQVRVEPMPQRRMQLKQRHVPKVRV